MAGARAQADLVLYMARHHGVVDVRKPRRCEDYATNVFVCIVHCCICKQNKINHILFCGKSFHWKKVYMYISFSTGRLMYTIVTFRDCYGTDSKHVSRVRSLSYNRRLKLSCKKEWLRRMNFHIDWLNDWLTTEALLYAHCIASCGHNSANRWFWPKGIDINFRNKTYILQTKVRSHPIQTLIRITYNSWCLYTSSMFPWYPWRVPSPGHRPPFLGCP